MLASVVSPCIAGEERGNARHLRTAKQPHWHCQHVMSPPPIPGHHSHHLPAGKPEPHAPAALRCPATRCLPWDKARKVIRRSRASAHLSTDTPTQHSMQTLDFDAPTTTPPAHGKPVCWLSGVATRARRTWTRSTRQLQYQSATRVRA